jgi:hypothetical protein
VRLKILLIVTLSILNTTVVFAKPVKGENAVEPSKETNSNSPKNEESIPNIQELKSDPKQTDTILPVDPVPTVTGTPNKGSNPKKPDSSQDNRSEVAKTVQELLKTGNFENGIGLQVKLIAKQQQLAQKNISSTIDALDARSDMEKLVFGPNYQSCNKLRNEIRENELRIEKLKTLQNQMKDQVEILKVQQVIEILNQQNTQLSERINAEEKTPSIFGWVIRYFLNI